MKAVKGIYEDGKLTLLETAPETGPVEVLIVFPDLPVDAEDPWEKILNDPRPRPAFEALIKEVEEDIAAGRTEPLDFDKL